VCVCVCVCRMHHFLSNRTQKHVTLCTDHACSAVDPFRRNLCRRLAGRTECLRRSATARGCTGTSFFFIQTSGVTFLWLFPSSWIFSLFRVTSTFLHRNMFFFCNFCILLRFSRLIIQQFSRIHAENRKKNYAWSWSF
jgi:hypothetical protein